MSTVDEHGIYTIPCAKGSTVVIDYTTEGTGISATEREKNSKQIYSLDGRSVRTMQPQTVYIVDGKKLLNK